MPKVMALFDRAVTAAEIAAELSLTTQVGFPGALPHMDGVPKVKVQAVTRPPPTAIVPASFVQEMHAPDGVDPQEETVGELPLKDMVPHVVIATWYPPTVPGVETVRE